MKVIGIICEYNPFHLGHKKQLDAIRDAFGEDCAIVCLMSGNFVQRGYPAIFDKSLRARAAIDCGADLVLELPVTYALSSAEGFAQGGVRILSNFCDYLCFGTETGAKESLLSTAKALLSPEFSPALHSQLETGKSFPAARQAALTQMGLDAALLENPNDILAVEYCKAILSQGSAMDIFPIHRMGSYHDSQADKENPSATAIRALLEQGACGKPYVPDPAQALYESAPLHTLKAGERSILARLRTMHDADFQALPYGSEGLWRKLMHNTRSCGTLEEILTATKSKRYTRSRLDRMVLCAFLGITDTDMQKAVPYTRVLAFTGKGATVLKNARKESVFPHVGERMDDPYWDLEQRCDNLYGLFCQEGPTPAGKESQRRVYIKK